MPKLYQESLRRRRRSELEGRERSNVVDSVTWAGWRSPERLDPTGKGSDLGLPKTTIVRKAARLVSLLCWVYRGVCGISAREAPPRRKASPRPLERVGHYDCCVRQARRDR